MALICDTGPLFAATDTADPDHVACVSLLPDATARLVVPVPVFVELEWLTASREGPQGFDTFLGAVEDRSLFL